MKKIFMLVAALAFGANVFAEDYTLYYDSTNGQKGTELSAVSQLRKLTFENGKLVMTYNDGTTKSTSLADIQRMFFATPETVGVEEVTNEIDATNVDAVYDLTGRKITVKLGENLPKGLYIVNDKKVLVK